MDQTIPEILKNVAKRSKRFKNSDILSFTCELAGSITFNSYLEYAIHWKTRETAKDTADDLLNLQTHMRKLMYDKKMLRKVFSALNDYQTTIFFSDKTPTKTQFVENPNKSAAFVNIIDPEFRTEYLDQLGFFLAHLITINKTQINTTNLSYFIIDDEIVDYLINELNVFDFSHKKTYEDKMKMKQHVQKSVILSLTNNPENISILKCKCIYSSDICTEIPTYINALKKKFPDFENIIKPVDAGNYIYLLVIDNTKNPIFEAFLNYLIYIIIVMGLNTLPEQFLLSLLNHVNFERTLDSNRKYIVSTLIKYSSKFYSKNKFPIIKTSLLKQASEDITKFFHLIIECSKEDFNRFPLANDNISLHFLTESKYVNRRYNTELYYYDSPVNLKLTQYCIKTEDFDLITVSTKINHVFYIFDVVSVWASPAKLYNVSWKKRLDYIHDINKKMTSPSEIIKAITVHRITNNENINFPSNVAGAKYRYICTAGVGIFTKFIVKFKGSKRKHSDVSSIEDKEEKLGRGYIIDSEEETGGSDID